MGSVTKLIVVASNPDLEHRSAPTLTLTLASSRRDDPLELEREELEREERERKEREWRALVEAFEYLEDKLWM